MVECNHLLTGYLAIVRGCRYEYNHVSSSIPIECLVVICAEVSEVVLSQMRLPEEAEPQLQSTDHFAGCCASSDGPGASGSEGES